MVNSIIYLYQILELSCYLYFILDFIINFYISENKLFFTFQTSSIIEYVSVIPPLLARTNAIQPNKPIYLMRVLHFLQCNKLDKVLQRHSWESYHSYIIYFAVPRLIYKPLFTVFSIVVINSCFLIVAEQKFDIHEYLYFMVVTISTVGFGDVYPESIFGKISIIIVVMIMFLVVPSQIQELTKALSYRSSYARITYQPNKDSEHILLLGSSQVEGFKTFLTELYHTDHGLNDTTALILQSKKPPEEMILLLKHP